MRAHGFLKTTSGFRYKKLFSLPLSLRRPLLSLRFSLLPPPPVTVNPATTAAVLSSSSLNFLIFHYSRTE